MTYVDGNAAIGALSLALGADVADASLECGHCGWGHPVAEARVYLRCPGIVMRCPACAGSEIVLVEIAHRFTVTMLGVAGIRFGVPTA